METRVDANATIYTGCFDALTRRFRTRTSRAEALLWGELKGRRLRGYRFERRRQVDRYLVDFYCSELRLAVDIFGSDSLRSGPGVDEEKTIRLRLCGVVFLPFAEEEILHNLDGVLTRIRQAIRFLPWK
jgi:very-short-patch-repair endonuclease